MPLWWNYIFFAAVIGWMVGNYFGKKEAKQKADQEIHYLKIAQTVDRRHYMAAVQRTLANEMMRRDPLHFIDVKEKAVVEVLRIAKLIKVACEEEMAVFARQHPILNDFDPFHTQRDHLLFADNWSSWDSIEEQYMNVIRFSALQNQLDENWRSWPTGAEDLEHAREYVRHIDDTRLWLRMKVAVGEWLRHRKVGEDQFEGRDFTLRLNARNRIAVEFRNPAEYGLVGDSSYEYIRSDAGFESETEIGHRRILGVTLPTPEFR